LQQQQQHQQVVLPARVPSASLSIKSESSV